MEKSRLAHLPLSLELLRLPGLPSRRLSHRLRLDRPGCRRWLELSSLPSSWRFWRLEGLSFRSICVQDQVWPSVWACQRC